MRLPDRDHSAALLIAGPGADLHRLHALRDALTNPVFGAFAPDRCHVLLDLKWPSPHVRSAGDTLLVYISGQDTLLRLPENSAANRLLIVEDYGSADLELSGWTSFLICPDEASSNRFGDVILRSLRDGVPDEPEMISLDLLAELCRQEVPEDVVVQGGRGEGPALGRNRAFGATSAAAEFLMFRHKASGVAQTLACRASLLEPGDPFDAALLLPEYPADHVIGAMSELTGSGLMNRDEAGEFRFAKPEYRSTAGSFLANEPAETVADIQFALKQRRMVRAGIAPRPHLSRDYWTTDDQLEYRPYAEAIAAFVRHPDSRPPLTIGVKGPWGAGKTSLMRMVRAELDDERPVELTNRSRAALTRRRRTKADTRVTNGEVLRHAAVPAGDEALTVSPPVSDWRATVWFNPWMYQNTEQVWAGLAHAIISQVTDRLRPGDRERFWLELNLARLDRLAVRRRAYRLFLERLLPFLFTFLLAAGAAAVMWVTGLAADAARWALAGGAGAVMVGGLVRYVVFRGQQATTGFEQLLSGPVAAGTQGLLDAVVPDPGYSSRTGFLHLVQHDMTRVLRMVATEDRPLVVFVDDLDRCSPGVVAEVIEAINLFLAGEFQNCVFVVAMEPEVVAAHVEVAYADLVAKLGKENGELGWRFLEKIVQLPMSLPAIDDQRHVPGYLRALLGAGPSPVPAPPEPSRPDTGDDKPAPPAPPTHPLLAAPMISPRMIPGPVGRIPLPLTEGEVIPWATSQIRALKPTLDTLPQVIQQVANLIPVQFQLMVPPHPAAARQLVLRAAEPVFGDLYTDTTAFDAIGAALPALRSANPREIKRYVNLFRFYSFITFRHRVDGTAPGNAQLAKLAALAIRWPELLGTLSRDHALDRLENAAGNDDPTAWDGELTELGWTATPRLNDLRAFLAQGPRISQVAHTVL